MKHALPSKVDDLVLSRGVPEPGWSQRGPIGKPKFDSYRRNELKLLQFVRKKYVRHGGVMNLQSKSVSMYHLKSHKCLKRLTVSVYRLQPIRQAFEGRRPQTLTCSRQRRRP